MEESVAKICIFGEDNSLSKKKKRKIINDLLKVSLPRKYNIQIYNYNINDNVTIKSDINIFLGVINPTLLTDTVINVFFFDLPKFNKKWRPYLDRMDNIITYNQYSYDLVCQLVSKNKVFLWNWYCDDMRISCKEKSLDSILHICNHLDIHNTNALILLWKEEWPQLIVYYDNKKANLTTDKENVLIIGEPISKEEYITMTNYYKRHIYFVSECEWNPMIYEAYSCEANVLLIGNNLATFTVSDNKLVLEKYTTEKYRSRYGNKYVINLGELTYMVEKLISMSEQTTIRNGKANRQFFLEKRREFRKKFEGYFSKMLDLLDDYTGITIPDKIDTDDELLPSDNLPRVSLVLLYNGDPRLVDKLVEYNINKTTYPKDKIQLVIGTNGSEVDLNLSIKHKLVKLDSGMKLGERYNKCIEKTNSDYVLLMHDDCVYFPNSIYNRVYTLVQEDISCSYGANKLYYDINGNQQYYTIKSPYLDHYKRCAPFSLSFKRALWKDNRFQSDWNTYNEVPFIKDNIANCLEISCNHIGISILHDNNRYTRSIRIFKKSGETIPVPGLEYLNTYKAIVCGDRCDDSGGNGDDNNSNLEESDSVPPKAILAIKKEFLENPLNPDNIVSAFYNNEPDKILYENLTFSNSEEFSDDEY